jgi:hypothetical protein
LKIPYPKYHFLCSSRQKSWIFNPASSISSRRQGITLIFRKVI